MSDSKVIVRKAFMQDKEFVMDCWLKGQYNSSPHWSQMPEKLFYKEYTSYIESILPSCSIKLAVLAEDQSMVIGCLVYSEDTVHWIYTKKDYRSQGVMNLLMKDMNLTQCSSTTLAGRAIAKKKKIIFNPFRR